MINVILLGAGNVACHLAKALEAGTDIQLIQRYARNNHNDAYFNSSIPFTNEIDNLMAADIYIIAISDNAIADFSSRLQNLNGLVVHTSGSMPLGVLNKSLRKGVLYPLQTFSKEQPIDFSAIPLVIEAETTNDYTLLHHLAKELSSNIFNIDSIQREQLHIAAVFVNNFTNYMYLSAKDICEESDISFDILKPLIFETAKKVMNLDPYVAQTGPGKRRDDKVLNKHLSSLKEEKKEIYKLMSKAIGDRFKK